MRKPKHKRTGYNRRRAARKRLLNSPLGRLCVARLSRRTREELLRNGWFVVDVRLTGAAPVVTPEAAPLPPPPAACESRPCGPDFPPADAVTDWTTTD